MSGEIVLEAQDLTKKFSAPSSLSVLKGVSLIARRSETLAVVGKSGVGKSTLLHILGSLEKPTSGTLRICGQKVSASSEAELRRNHIGFIFQGFHLFEDYTVIDNVLMAARIARKQTHKKSAAYQRALLLLDEVGLLPRAHFPAKLLSGGEKQRTALARALINDPDIIFADEPTGNLDRVHSEQINQLLLSTASAQGKTLIVVTHDEKLASACDITYHLSDGHLTR